MTERNVEPALDHVARVRGDLVLGASGLLFVLLTIAPVVIPHESLSVTETAASADELPSSAEIHAFFERNATMQAAQPWFHLLGLAAFCVFAGRLAGHLRADPRSAPWAPVAAVSAAGMVAIMGVAMAFVAALLLQRAFLDGRTFLVLYDVAWDLHFKVNYVAPVFLGAISWGAKRSGLMSGWLTWVGLVAAALVLLSTLAHLSEEMFFAQYPAFFLVLAWALLVAVMGLLGRVGPAAPRAA